MSLYFVFLSRIILVVANFQLLIHWTAAFDPKAFDDSILYKLNWPGDVYAGIFDENGILITSDIKERFRCVLPEIDEKSNDEVEKYTGENPLDLLQPLFKAARCSYKLGSYWTYEICHGSHVRQYHEDREMKTPKGQDYSLGKWDAVAVEKLREELEEVDENGEKKYLSKKLPVIKIENLKLPYLRVNMTDGTFCELSKKPRVTYVLYVCYKHGKHEVYSFKEISTCEYETVVLSPLLCNHPKFRPHITSEKNINCHSALGALAKPRGLYELEQESAKLRQNKVLEDKLKKTLAVLSVKTEDGRRKVHVEFIPVDAAESDEADKIRQATQFNQKAMTPVEEFLSGRECLHGGGTSWWKYEFCLGRHVIQYHEEKDGSKTVLQLGTYDEALHKDWLQRNPHKRPLPPDMRKQISHYYSNGDICDKTGEPRSTEVRFKCTDAKTSAGAISLSILEPTMCEYVLNVESPAICELLPNADKDGLFKWDDDDMDVTVQIDFSTAKPLLKPGSGSASGPPGSAEERKQERGDTADPVRVTVEDDSAEDDQRTASSQRKDDRATGEPRTFKPSGQKPSGQRGGRNSLNDEL